MAKIAEEPRNKKDPVRSFAVNNALITLQDAGFVDPGADALLSALSPLAQVATPEAFAIDPLVQAIQEYKTNPHTPELVDGTFQIVWRAWGERDDHIYEVPSCDRTTDKLAALARVGKGVLLIPDEVYTPEGLARLGRIFPQMRMREGTTVANEYDGGGCIDVEMAVDAPYRTAGGYKEPQLRDIIAADGRKGQRLATYIVGSQVNKLLTGCYFDQELTLSRLPGSSVGGRTVSAAFDRGGGLDVSTGLFRQYRLTGLGGRSEGLKQAA